MAWPWPVGDGLNEALCSLRSGMNDLKRILIVPAASVAMALSCFDAAAADVTNSYTLTYDGLGVANGAAIPDPYPGIAAATVTHFGVDQNIALFEDVYFWDGLSPGNGYGNLTNVAKGPSGTPAVPPAYGVVSITPNYSNNFVRIISCDFASLDNGGGDATSLIAVRDESGGFLPYLNSSQVIAGDGDPSTRRLSEGAGEFQAGEGHGAGLAEAGKAVGAVVQVSQALVDVGQLRHFLLQFAGDFG